MLQLEISNITSNCDLADKHMTEAVEWDDCELMDAKEIFLKTVEFIRNFETETGDYQRRVRFVMAHDPNQLVHHVAGECYPRRSSLTRDAARTQPLVKGALVDRLR